MKLIYLSRANLADKSFIHDFAHHFSKKEKAILLHDLFGPLAEDTRFVTKRLSAVLSEGMVVNFPVSGDQRNLLSGTESAPVVKNEIIHKAFETVSVFITNRLLSSLDNTGADPLILLNLLRKEFNAAEVLFFSSNSRSPIALSPKKIEDSSDFEKLLEVYEEEREILELAFHSLPSKIVSPANMFL